MQILISSKPSSTSSLVTHKPLTPFSSHHSAQRDSIQPAATAGPAGGGAEFIPTPRQAFTYLVN